MVFRGDTPRKHLPDLADLPPTRIELSAKHRHLPSTDPKSGSGLTRLGVLLGQTFGCYSLLVFHRSEFEGKMIGGETLNMQFKINSENSNFSSVKKLCLGIEVAEMDR
jgi:hypothetical protein